MLSSTNIGLDLPRDIDPCVNWKTAPKGRRRGTRRVRNSTSGDSNRKKAAMTSSNGSEIASDEEFKEADQVLASESEKLSVTILGRRFSDTIQSVPIKKRMRLQTGSSATLPLDCGQVSTPETGSAFLVEDSSLDNHIDFSGISILADAACKSDEGTNHFSTSEVQSPTTSKGENGVVMPQEAHEIKSPKYDCTSVPLEISSTHVVTTEVVNNGLEKSSKAENVSRGSRLHWDLNTVMDAWDCDQQEGGDSADYEQKSSVVACNTEMCNDYKEEAVKDGYEDHKITCRNDGDVPELASPKSELHGTELRKEGAIFTEVDPKERIVETVTHPKDCSVPITPFGPSSTKEEVENKNEPYSNQLSASEHGQLSMCKPSDVKEEIEMAGSITEKPFEVDPQLEPTAGPELILEVCNKEPVACAPGSEPKDSMMDNDQTGTNAITGVDIVEHDSMAVDDKPEHDALQTDCGQLAEERNQADLPHIETVLMPTIDNDNGHTTDEKVDQQVDLTASGKFSVEVNKHGNSVEFQSDHNHSNFYPPKKDLEEDDYQYEDGELREPAMPYWETDGFKLTENEHGPHDADERCDKHAVTLDPPQSKENLLVADTGVQPNDCMDNDVIVRMDMESNDQTKLLQNGQANNLSENESAEYMHSSKLKATGWDKQPESLRKNSESPLKQEIVAGASSLRGDALVCVDTLRSSDDSHRDDSSFVRSRRSKEDELDGRVELNPRASRMHERGIPSRHSDASRREEHWVETRINTGRTRHRTTEFGAPSYAPSNSGNATAASIAKVKSNGFMVAPDGTLVKANGSCSTRKCQNSSSFYQGSPTERDHRGLGSSRERIVSPGRFGGIQGGRVGRCAVEPAREQYHRPSIEISPDRRRQRSFSPHRGHIRHISPSHIGSPSRSRTRSPNTWFSPPARGRCLADHEPRHERGRSPIHRMRPDYDDRIGAPIHSNHHHFPPHGLRCVNDRRCTSPGNIMRRSPPRNARFYQLDSPPPPLHRQRDEFYHHPVHSARCNGFDHRRGFEEERYELVRPERTFQRNMNGDRFRPHNSSQKSLDSHRRSPPRGFNRGLVGDVNHRGKEDGDSFKYVTGGRHNNGKYEKREVRDRSSGGDDATARRRLP